LPLKRLSLSIVGPAGLALERTFVLTIDLDEGSRPAGAEFVIAQDVKTDALLLRLSGIFRLVQAEKGMLA
jgi:hypothetical protein